MSRARAVRHGLDKRGASRYERQQKCPRDWSGDEIGAVAAYPRDGSADPVVTVGTVHLHQERGDSELRSRAAVRAFGRRDEHVGLLPASNPRMPADAVRPLFSSCRGACGAQPRVRTRNGAPSPTGRSPALLMGGP